MAGLSERLLVLQQLRERGLLSKEAWDSACVATIGNNIRTGGGSGEQRHRESATQARRKAMNADKEVRARIELAAAYRMAAHCGLNEADQNHFTLIHPTKAGKMLLIPQGMMWSEVRAGDLAEVDVGSEDVEEEEEEVTVQKDGITKSASSGNDGSFAGAFDVEISAFVIHAPLHRRRPDAAAVLHTHMPYATALASLADPELKMCNLNCLRFFDRVAYQRHYLGGTQHKFFPNESGEMLSNALGPTNTVLVLANHGCVVPPLTDTSLGQQITCACERYDWDFTYCGIRKCAWI